MNLVPWQLVVLGAGLFSAGSLLAYGWGRRQIVELERALRRLDNDRLRLSRRAEILLDERDEDRREVHEARETSLQLLELRAKLAVFEANLQASESARRHATQDRDRIVNEVALRSRSDWPGTVAGDEDLASELAILRTTVLHVRATSAAEVAQARANHSAVEQELRLLYESHDAHVSRQQVDLSRFALRAEEAEAELMMLRASRHTATVISELDLRNEMPDAHGIVVAVPLTIDLTSFDDQPGLPRFMESERLRS